jgi:5,10-methylenetetrahydrofolate reductase
MPEVILCTYCDKPIDKVEDEYVSARKATHETPEALAHVTCQQARRKDNGITEALTTSRTPRHQMVEANKRSYDITTVYS